MARPKKNVSLEEQLVNITTEIETLELSLKEKKALKKNLEEQIKLARLSALDELITASGKSFDELKDMLTAPEKTK